MCFKTTLIVELITTGLHASKICGYNHGTLKSILPIDAQIINCEKIYSCSKITCYCKINKEATSQNFDVVTTIYQFLTNISLITTVASNVNLSTK